MNDRLNDQQRLAALLERIKRLEGLDDETFLQLNMQLDRKDNRFGYDDDGRLKVAFYDAKSYDRQSFEKQRTEQFAFHFLDARLDVQTAAAAGGFRVVCLFVSDVCDAEVVEQLAMRGVELIALRCAGFNNVDLAAARDLDLTESSLRN